MESKLTFNVTVDIGDYLDSHIEGCQFADGEFERKVLCLNDDAPIVDFADEVAEGIVSDFIDAAVPDFFEEVAQVAEVLLREKRKG